MPSENWMEGLKPANLRNTIQQNSMVVTIIMIIILAIGIGLIGFEAGWWTKKPPGLTGAYFIDEDTGEITVKSPSEIPPLIGAGGKPTVVSVVFYTCTTCSDKKPAYYLKRTDAVKAYIEQHRNDPPSKSDRPSPVDLLHMTGEDQLIRAPEKGSPWFPARSTMGMQIENSSRQNCKPDDYKICEPG